MWIVDHNSADPTRAIIRRLIKEGLPLTLSLVFDSEHRQAERLTALARKATIADRADIVLPLDADEFVRARGGRARLETCLRATANRPVLLPWTTYVPTPDDNELEPDCLRRVVHRRRSEGRKAYFKVAVPAHLFLDTATLLAEGSHGVVRSDGKPIEHLRAHDVSIAHYPIRSDDQALSKILLGELSLRLKTERETGEGRHWAALYARLRNNLSIARNELLDIAAGYGGNGPRDVVTDPIGAIPYAELRYPELVDTNVVRRVLAFTEQMVQSRSQGYHFAAPFVATADACADGQHRQCCRSDHGCRQCRTIDGSNADSTGATRHSRPVFSGGW